MSDVKRLPKRSEVETKDTWAMEDMYPSDEAWETDYEKALKLVEGYKRFEGRLAESPDILFECLRFDDALSMHLERLYVYAKQKWDEDTTVNKYQDFSSRASSLNNKAAALSSYIVPEILDIEDGKLDEFMKAGNGIEHFSRMITLIRRRKPHTLSAKTEALLADVNEVAESTSYIYNMFNGADVKFPEIKDEDGNLVAVTQGNYVSFLESSDRRVREAAFHSLYSTYKQFKNTMAATFGANIKQAVFFAKTRNYPSTRAYYLSDSNIPEQVYDNLIKTVHENLPLLHRYVGLRKKALALDELHMYDLYTPIVGDVDRKFSFEQAKEMVLEGLAPLGEDYLNILKEGFEGRWIDVYENDGKRSGAYSWGCYGLHPYVLLNYHGTLDDVFTLAHEMGHAIHSYLSDENQPFTDAGYKIFVAEVASTCNEALLIRHLLNANEDPKERAYLINHFLESFRGTFFRQAMFAEFENLMHKEAETGKTLTADVICSIYHRLNEEYYGPSIVVDEDIDVEWERIHHFYRPFYVYQYATGFSAAVAISDKILKGDQKTLDGYFKFLKSGGSMDPIDLLKLCGIDMTDPEPVENAVRVFAEYLKEIEPLL